jgi:response regulator NasT
MTAPLTIVVVEPDRSRGDLIAQALREAGAQDVHLITDLGDIAGSVARRRPDLVLIDIANPSRDTLEELTLATGPLERPVALFVDRSDDRMTEAAIEAGVSAYVVDGLRPERIKPVMDAAIARFRLFQRMRTELDAAKRALEERKVIDRAKGMLMRSRGVGEEEAYALLRKAAMDQGRKVADVAEALVMAARLLS